MYKHYIAISKTNIINKLRVLKTRAASYISGNGGFGLNEVLGIAAALIIAAFVVIPQLRDFASLITDRLGTWWTGISGTIFPAS
jgi:hypothetical protein